MGKNDKTQLTTAISKQHINEQTEMLFYFRIRCFQNLFHKNIVTTRKGNLINRSRRK